MICSQSLLLLEDGWILRRRGQCLCACVERKKPSRWHSDARINLVQPGRSHTRTTRDTRTVRSIAAVAASEEVGCQCGWSCPPEFQVDPSCLTSSQADLSFSNDLREMAKLILNQLGAQLMTSELSFRGLRVFARSHTSLGSAQAELVRVASLSLGDSQEAAQGWSSRLHDCMHACVKRVHGSSLCPHVPYEFN